MATYAAMVDEKMEFDQIRDELTNTYEMEYPRMASKLMGYAKVEDLEKGNDSKEKERTRHEVG
jgi:hypothetical protein